MEVIFQWYFSVSHEREGGKGRRKKEKEGNEGKGEKLYEIASTVAVFLPEPFLLCVINKTW